jgi:hypothetical protein
VLVLVLVLVLVGMLGDVYFWCWFCPGLMVLVVKEVREGPRGGSNSRPKLLSQTFYRGSNSPAAGVSSNDSNPLLSTPKEISLDIQVITDIQVILEQLSTKKLSAQ